MIISIKKNLGSLDRILRGAVGLILFGFILFRPFPISTTWLAILVVLGIFILLEAALGY